MSSRWCGGCEGAAAGLIWGGLACNCHTSLSEKQKARGHTHRHGRELAEKESRKLTENQVSGDLLQTCPRPPPTHPKMNTEVLGKFQMDGKVAGRGRVIG